MLIFVVVLEVKKQESTGDINKGINELFYGYPYWLRPDSLKLWSEIFKNIYLLQPWFISVFIITSTPKTNYSHYSGR